MHSRHTILQNVLQNNYLVSDSFKTQLGQALKTPKAVSSFSLFVREIWLCLHVVVVWVKEAFSSIMLHVFVFMFIFMLMCALMQGKHAVICTEN